MILDEQELADAYMQYAFELSKLDKHDPCYTEKAVQILKKAVNHHKILENRPNLLNNASAPHD